MNIGDKDADGWTYVRFGDAAKAAQEGVHECQMRVDDSSCWIPADLFSVNGWQFRIREKARTITVIDLPTPQRVTKYDNQEIDCVVCIQFCDHKTANKARDIISAAMEQS